ncbi:hypothetical protein KRR40_08695 [Niabella defluvii]|nr:hypothetical protein KRR40_08695 [Niabella sp. I65]
MNVVGNSPNTRTVQVKLNNMEVFNAALNGFAYSRLSNSLPASALNGATENISVANIAGVPNNRIKIGTLEITYPRSFNFGAPVIFNSDYREPPAENTLKLQDSILPEHRFYTI